MKTIKYLGVEYEVPNWVKFVVADEDGALYGYEHRPAGYGALRYTANNGRDFFIKNIKPEYPIVEV